MLSAYRFIARTYKQSKYRCCMFDCRHGYTYTNTHRRSRTANSMLMGRVNYIIFNIIYVHTSIVILLLSGLPCLPIYNFLLISSIYIYIFYCYYNDCYYDHNFLYNYYHYKHQGEKKWIWAAHLMEDRFT